MTWPWLLLVPAYAAGMIPSASVAGRLGGFDPTQQGSGNPGASNVFRLAGRSPGVLVFVADFAKGVVPTIVALAVADRHVAVGCWVAAVVGHVYPVSRGFRGGKGVATTGGGTAALFPLVAATLVVVFLAVSRSTGRASLGSLTIAVALPILVALARGSGPAIGAAVGLAALVVVRHRDNIRRIVRREEYSYRSE